MTLLVRDEEDVLESMLEFHLATGVDHVIATDHRSTDGTTEILRHFERRGVLTYAREDREAVSQGAITTAMARSAAVDHGADWVIPADADEFWWSRDRRSRTRCSRRFPALLRPARRVAPLRAPPDDDREVHERMTIRCRPLADLDAIYQRQVEGAVPRAPRRSRRDGKPRASDAFHQARRCEAGIRSRSSTSRSGRWPSSSGRSAALAAGLAGRHMVAAAAHPGGIEGLRASLCP